MSLRARSRIAARQALRAGRSARLTPGVSVAYFAPWFAIWIPSNLELIRHWAMQDRDSCRPHAVIVGPADLPVSLFMGEPDRQAALATARADPGFDPMVPASVGRMKPQCPAKPVYGPAARQTATRGELRGRP